MSNDKSIKGTTNCRLFKRSAPDANSEKLGIWEKGEKVTIISKTKGSAFEGSDEWYELDGGIYSWAGGIITASYNQIENYKDTSNDYSSININPQLLTYSEPHKFIGVDKAHKKTLGENVKIGLIENDFPTSMLDSGIFNKIELINLTSENYDCPYWESHGFRMASLINALPVDNQCIGIAPKAELYIFKINVINGNKIPINESFQELFKNDLLSKMDIVNISQNFNNPVNIVSEKIKELNHISFVISVGNNVNYIKYPARIEEAISVMEVSVYNNILSPKRKKEDNDKILEDPLLDYCVPSNKIFLLSKLSSSQTEIFNDAYSSEAAAIQTGVIAIANSLNRKHSDSIKNQNKYRYTNLNLLL